MFEGMLANGFAAGGQLTTTTDVENLCVPARLDPEHRAETQELT